MWKPAQSLGILWCKHGFGSQVPTRTVVNSREWSRTVLAKRLYPRSFTQSSRLGSDSKPKFQGKNLNNLNAKGEKVGMENSIFASTIPGMALEQLNKDKKIQDWQAILEAQDSDIIAQRNDRGIKKVTDDLASSQLEVLQMPEKAPEQMESFISLLKSARAAFQASKHTDKIQPKVEEWSRKVTSKLDELVETGIVPNESVVGPLMPIFSQFSAPLAHWTHTHLNSPSRVSQLWALSIIGSFASIRHPISHLLWLELAELEINIPLSTCVSLCCFYSYQGLIPSYRATVDSILKTNEHEETFLKEEKRLMELDMTTRHKQLQRLLRKVQQTGTEQAIIVCANFAIRGLLSQDKVVEATRELSALQRLRITPTLEILQEFLKYYSLKVGQSPSYAQQVELFHERIRKQNLVPDLRTYSALINYYEKTQQFRQMNHLLHEVTKLSISKESKASGGNKANLESDATSQQSTSADKPISVKRTGRRSMRIMSEETREVVEGDEVFSPFAAPVLDKSTFGTQDMEFLKAGWYKAIYSALALGSMRKAMGLVEDMQSFGLELTDEICLQFMYFAGRVRNLEWLEAWWKRLCSILKLVLLKKHHLQYMRSLLKLDRVTEARQTMAHVCATWGHSDDLYALWLNYYSSRGLLSSVEITLRQMEHHKVQFGVYTTSALMEMYASKGDLSNMLHWLAEWKKLSSNVHVLDDVMSKCIFKYNESGHKVDDVDLWINALLTPVSESPRFIGSLLLVLAKQKKLNDLSRLAAQTDPTTDADLFVGHVMAFATLNGPKFVTALSDLLKGAEKLRRRLTARDHEKIVKSLRKRFPQLAVNWMQDNLSHDMEPTVTTLDELCSAAVEVGEVGKLLDMLSQYFQKCGTQPRHNAARLVVKAICRTDKETIAIQCAELPSLYSPNPGPVMVIIYEELDHVGLLAVKEAIRTRSYDKMRTLDVPVHLKELLGLK